MELDFERDAGILEKYAVSGPRYTSYPTANVFHERFTKQDYVDECTQLRNRISPISVYVHIPFCERACFYCGCNRTITRSRDYIQQYLDGAVKEIKRHGELHRHRPVLQLHWGGGTPNYLDHSQMTELMHELAVNFNLDGSDSRDFSIEIDPRSIHDQSIALISGLGFNRISLGIQDFDPQVQKAINRNQSFESILELMNEIKRFNFNSINFDLIYGLPYQNLDRMERTLEQVLQLQPNRIACYNYAHMPDRFPAQVAIQRSGLPSRHEKLRLFELISKTLTSSGYSHIGLDHFALHDDPLCKAAEEGSLQRNFQGYSKVLAEDLVGIGSSAISEVGDCYLQNEKDLDAYLVACSNDGLAINRGLRLNRKDWVRKRIIQSLCCELKLDSKEIEREFYLSFPQTFASQIELLKDFEADGLVRWDGHILIVTYAGRYVLRNICMIFDDYLNASQTRPN